MRREGNSSDVRSRPSVFECLLAVARVWITALPILIGVSCGNDDARRPSVLLITLDTTRADSLGAYGREPSVTPNLDQLAAEGTTYLWARTVTPTTLPAHASMLTGLYPNRHTVRDNALTALPSSAATLAERAAAAKFTTAAFVSAKVLDESFGLAQGFETYSQPRREKDVLVDPSFASRRASETAAEFDLWLTQRAKDASFFAWVHFFDAHAPWDAGEAWLARAGGHPYLAEVAAQDDAVRQLIESLRRTGRFDDTTVLVVGDHGEGLGDHGEATHAYFVFDSTLRVPFLLRRADATRAGERSEEMVSVVDVLPTLLDALALPVPADLDGQSLWRAPTAPDRGVYFESYYGFLHYGMAPLAGWVDASAKYVHSTRQELYHPRRSPLERKNLLGELDVDAQRYRTRIAEQQSKTPLAPDTRHKLELHALRDVQALGYAGAIALDGELPGAFEPSDRPSPHERADELRKCERARDLFVAGRIEDSARLLREVLAENPRNTFALEHLGFAQFHARDDDGARRSFEQALAIGPERAAVRRGLGLVFERTGETDLAVAAFERAFELDPSDVEVLLLLLRIAAQRGDADEQERLRERIKRSQSP